MSILSAILQQCAQISHDIILENEIVEELVQANFQRVYFTNHDEWRSARSPSGVEIISGDVWESIIKQTL